MSKKRYVVSVRSWIFEHHNFHLSIIVKGKSQYGAEQKALSRIKRQLPGYSWSVISSCIHKRKSNDHA